MTRKTTFRTFLLGATALTLAACGEAKEDALVFESVEACIASGEQDEAVCRAEFEKAQQRHEDRLLPGIRQPAHVTPILVSTSAEFTTPPPAHSGCPSWSATCWRREA